MMTCWASDPPYQISWLPSPTPITFRGNLKRKLDRSQVCDNMWHLIFQLLNILWALYTNCFSHHCLVLF